MHEDENDTYHPYQAFGPVRQQLVEVDGVDMGNLVCNIVTHVFVNGTTLKATGSSSVRGSPFWLEMS